MEYRKFGNLDFKVSAVGLGTWVIGGWVWGDYNDEEVACAVETSLLNGITLIDTAPIYGFGRAESIIGKTIRRLKARERVILATKCGIEWDLKKRTIRRNSSRKRILKEIDNSRTRLGTDVIDIYQIHWPDELTPIQETMEQLYKFYEAGTIRAIGVSNFSVPQMEECLKAGPLHSLQPPYHLFERGIEKEILPFCREKGIAVLGYGALCRGLLTGKFKPDSVFPEGDVRCSDEKFQKGNFEKYVLAVDGLKDLARKKNLSVAQMAIQWAARTAGVTAMLAGARNSSQAAENAGAFDFVLEQEDISKIESIAEAGINRPIDSGFMVSSSSGS